MGFEPTRAEPNGLAVHRLNLSATSSSRRFIRFVFLKLDYYNYFWSVRRHPQSLGWTQQQPGADNWVVGGNDVNTWFESCRQRPFTKKACPKIDRRRMRSRAHLLLSYFGIHTQ